MRRIEAASREQIDDVLVKRCSLLAAAAASIVPRKRQVFDAGPITRQWNLKGPHSNEEGFYSRQRKGEDVSPRGDPNFVDLEKNPGVNSNGTWACAKTSVNLQDGPSSR